MPPVATVPLKEIWRQSSGWILSAYLCMLQKSRVHFPMFNNNSELGTFSCAFFFRLNLALKLVNYIVIFRLGGVQFSDFDLEGRKLKLTVKLATKLQTTTAKLELPAHFSSSDVYLCKLFFIISNNKSNSNK